MFVGFVFCMQRHNWQYEVGVGVKVAGPLWFYILLNVTVSQQIIGPTTPGPQTADGSELKEAAIWKFIPGTHCTVSLRPQRVQTGSPDFSSSSHKDTNPACLFNPLFVYLLVYLFIFR